MTASGSAALPLTRPRSEALLRGDDGALDAGAARLIRALGEVSGRRRSARDAARHSRPGDGLETGGARVPPPPPGVRAPQGGTP